MKFRKRNPTFFFLILLMTELLFSENSRIIKSPKSPIHGNLNLKLKRDLILGEETKGQYLFFSVNGIEVSNKYIYVLDSKMAKIKVYDLKGKLVREIGRKGEGPGEFVIPQSFCISASGDLYVYDLQRAKMTVFSDEGDYKKDFIVEQPFIRKFYVDEKDYIYTTFDESDSENFLNRDINFARLNPEGKVEKIFYKTFHLKMVPFERKGMKGNLFYEHPYLTHLYFTNIPKDNLVLMNSMRYEIILLSKEGDILLRILKEEKSPKVSQREKEIALSMEKDEDIRKLLMKHATFSKTRPFCSNLLSDEKGRIYVERFKPLTEEEKPFTYEIFNAKGEYLYKLSLDFKIDLIKNGYIYTVSTNKETGEIKIIRYKIENWKEIK